MPISAPFRTISDFGLQKGHYFENWRKYTIDGNHLRDRCIKSNEFWFINNTVLDVVAGSPKLTSLEKYIPALGVLPEVSKLRAHVKYN